jgi:hypothetical protein
MGSGEWLRLTAAVGVAVVIDILVVLCDGVRCSRRSVMIFASALGGRVLFRSFPPSACKTFGEGTGDCGAELLALGFEDE